MEDFFWKRLKTKQAIKSSLGIIERIGADKNGYWKIIAN
jgi:hypothetical protein